MKKIVKVCGIPYTVEEYADIFNADGIHFGQVDYLAGKIIINSRATEEIKKETLCHEILHAILVNIGRSDMSEDEMLVQQLGNAINQTFEIKWDQEEKQ